MSSQRIIKMIEQANRQKKVAPMWVFYRMDEQNKINGKTGVFKVFN